MYKSLDTKGFMIQIPDFSTQGVLGLGYRYDVRQYLHEAMEGGLDFAPLTGMYDWFCIAPGFFMDGGVSTSIWNGLHQGLDICRSEYHVAMISGFR